MARDNTNKRYAIRKGIRSSYTIRNTRYGILNTPKKGRDKKLVSIQGVSLKIRDKGRDTYKALFFLTNKKPRNQYAVFLPMFYLLYFLYLLYLLYCTLLKK